MLPVRTPISLYQFHRCTHGPPYRDSRRIVSTLFSNESPYTYTGWIGLPLDQLKDYENYLSKSPVIEGGQIRLTNLL